MYFHYKLAHVTLSQSDRWVRRQLLDLWQFPGPGTPRVLVQEMLPSLKVPAMQRAAEVDVLNCLGLLGLVLQPPCWVVKVGVQFQLPQNAEPRARRRSHQEIRVLLFDLPLSRASMTSPRNISAVCQVHG